MQEVWSWLYGGKQRNRIGKRVIVNTGSTVDHDCIIGDYVHIAPGCHISGNVVIGDGVWIGVSSCIRNNIAIC